MVIMSALAVISEMQVACKLFRSAQPRAGRLRLRVRSTAGFASRISPRPNRSALAGTVRGRLRANLRGLNGCGSLRAMSAPTDLDPKELRPLLHAEIDKLRDEDLALAHRALQEIELHQVADELDDAADEARAAGRLTPERIAEAIAAHRAAHPYR